MDPIVRRLRESRIDSLTKELTEIRSDFFHVLYESKREGTLSYTGSMMLEAFEENPDTSVEDIQEEDYIPNEEELEEDMDVTDIHIMKDKGKSVVSLKIGGVEYRYISPNMTAEQLLSKFNSIAKYSTGRAFAWLKKNSVLYYNGRLRRYESKKRVSEDMEIPDEKEKKSIVRSEVHPVSTADKPNIADAVTESKSAEAENWVIAVLNNNKILDGDYEFKNGNIIGKTTVNINGRPVRNPKVGTYTIRDGSDKIVVTLRNTSGVDGEFDRFVFRTLANHITKEIGKKTIIELK